MASGPDLYGPIVQTAYQRELERCVKMESGWRVPQYKNPSKGEQYLRQYEPELMKIGAAMKRAGYGSNKIHLMLPGDEIGPELWAELDGSDYLGIPVIVTGDIDVLCVLMELEAR